MFSCGALGSLNEVSILCLRLEFYGGFAEGSDGGGSELLDLIEGVVLKVGGLNLHDILEKVDGLGKFQSLAFVYLNIITDKTRPFKN